MRENVRAHRPQNGRIKRAPVETGAHKAESRLVTNAAKYARGNIIVQIGGTPPTGYSMSVLDAGPGLPVGFDPARCKSLGMKIVLALAKQIGGMLQFVPGDKGQGTKFTVIF
jgi:two-component system, sensor histidine kinase PdtaS